MKFKFYCLIAFLFSFSLARAQNITIKGRVYDNNNNVPLPGARVHFDGISSGVSTDINGAFIFNNINIAPGNNKIKVSYVGYKEYEKEITVTAGKVFILDIPLKLSTQELQGVNVYGKINKETDVSTRVSEKNADNVTNIVGAQAILRSPDINAANVLQRVSGITIQKNSGGDEAYAVIRGIEPRYNNTLINGVKIASPDNKSRFVSLDIVPSEILQRIEVSKSLTPEMEGDAIGGTVNLIFKDAPDSLLFNASGSIGYSSIFFDRKFTDFSKREIRQQSIYDTKGPGYAAMSSDFSRSNLDFKQKTAPPTATLGFTYGNRFLNRKLGILIADNYQNQYYGANSQFNNAVPDPRNHYLPYSTDIANRTYSNQQLNNGLNVHADYAINDRNKITLNNVFLYSYFAQAFLSVDTTLVGGDAGRSLYKGKPVPGTGSVHNNYRSTTNHQTLENLKIDGKHILTDHLLLDWAGVYSNATKKAPDRAEFNTNQRISYDSIANKFTTTPFYYDGGTRIWQQNTDKDYNGLLNLTYKGKAGHASLEIKAGGLYRHKERDNYQNQYNQFAVGGNNSIGSRQQFTTIYDARDSIINPNGTAGYDLNNYHAFENITAGYGEFKITFQKLDILAGVRVENTSQGYHYLQFVQDAIDNVTKTYTDILPSVQLKYRLNDKTNLRAAYFKSISRPGFFEIIPYHIYGNDGYDEIGNPNLLHTTADNFDIRYELFPKPDQQLFIGGFYKKLQNPIENAFVSGGNQIVFKPTNSTDATIYGGELVYTKYWGNYGVTGNYSYTYSNVHGAKKDPATGGIVYQDRPLQGQTDNELNLSVEYKSVKHGLFIQLAYQYVGRTLADIYPNAGYDYYQQPQSFLSLSADKGLNRHFTIFGKFNNLLNTPTTLKIDNLLTGRDISKATGLIGIRYSH
jgi:TonB-dependent receptor